MSTPPASGDKPGLPTSDDNPKGGLTKEDPTSPVRAEILSTENSYLEALKKIKAFRNILKSHPNREKNPAFKEFLDRTEIIESMHDFSEKLIDDIEKIENQKISTIEKNKKIAELFLQVGSFFNTYKDYVSSYEGLIKFLEKEESKNKEFKELVENFKELHGDLSSLLINPIQRIPRYILLLKELSRSSEKQKIPEVSSDQTPTSMPTSLAGSLAQKQEPSSLIKQAIKKMEDVGTNINQHMKTTEIQQSFLLGKNKDVEFSSESAFFKMNLVDKELLKKQLKNLEGFTDIELDENEKFFKKNNGIIKCKINGKDITFEIEKTQSEGLINRLTGKSMGFRIKIEGTHSLTPGELKTCYEAAEKIGAKIIDCTQNTSELVHQKKISVFNPYQDKTVRLYEPPPQPGSPANPQSSTTSVAVPSSTSSQPLPPKMSQSGLSPVKSDGFLTSFKRKVSQLGPSQLMKELRQEQQARGLIPQDQQGSKKQTSSNPETVPPPASHDPKRGPH